MTHILRPLSATALVFLFAAMMSSSASAQGISVTFPTMLASAPDYATEVLGDPWDMCNAQDISPDPDQLVGFSSFTFRTSPCRADGTTRAVSGHADSSVMMLTPGFWHHALNPGRNGRNFPIDSSKYQVLSFKMTSSAAEYPHVFWLHNPSSHPSGPGMGERRGLQTASGTQLLVADLTQSPVAGSSLWTDGVVRGLRLDVNAVNPVMNVSLHWVRLTPGESSPLAKKQTISWSGGSGATTITVQDNSDGSVFPVASGLTGSSYLWNYGVLAPGDYRLTVTRGSMSGTHSFTINSPPSIELTNPSQTSGPDYATMVLGNAWDMSSAADIQLTGSDYLTNVSFNGMLNATNTNNDPNVTLLYNTNNSVPIDTSRFRYLTFRLQVDGAYDLGEGSVARVVWNSQTLMSGTTATVSQDIIVWPGMNSYTIDLAGLSAAQDGGLEPVGAAEPWTSGVKRHLRLDPHEFPQARSFHIDDVKLTAKPAAGATFPIQFVSTDADGDAATVWLYYDNDTNAGNGKTLIASAVPRSAGQFIWNTAGVPQGEYFIYAEATDGIQSIARYSTVPVQVAPVPPAPKGFRIIR